MVDGNLSRSIDGETEDESDEAVDERDSRLIDEGTEVE